MIYCSYNKSDEIYLYQQKDKTNIQKHGVSLRDASKLDWDDGLFWIDDRKDYGEVRCIGLAPMKNRLYFIVYVNIGTQRRVISLRKANRREFMHYEKETN